MLSLAHVLQLNELNVQGKVISLEGGRLLVFPDVPGSFRSFGHWEKCAFIIVAVTTDNINAQQTKF